MFSDTVTSTLTGTKSHTTPPRREQMSQPPPASGTRPGVVTIIDTQAVKHGTVWKIGNAILSLTGNIGDVGLKKAYQYIYIQFSKYMYRYTFSAVISKVTKARNTEECSVHASNFLTLAYNIVSVVTKLLISALHNIQTFQTTS